MSKVIGVDPGLQGAIAFLEDDKTPVLFDMPLVVKDSRRKEISPTGLFAIFDGLTPNIDLVTIEEVNGGGSTFGSASAFTFGKGFGEVLSALELYGYRVLRVPPMTWKNKVLAGTDKSKEAAIAYVTRRWPDVVLVPPRCRKPSHDRAESVCLALYGQLQLQGK